MSCRLLTVATLVAGVSGASEAAEKFDELARPIDCPSLSKSGDRDTQGGPPMNGCRTVLNERAFTFLDKHLKRP